MTHRISAICTSLLILVGLAMPAASRGAVVFSEDFEGIAVGDPVTTANSVFTAAVANGTFSVANDNPPLLQNGGTNPFTGSKYMVYNDLASTPTLRAPANLNSTFSISFDYFEPNQTSGTQTALRLALTNGTLTPGTGGSAANRAVEINISGASVGAVDEQVFFTAIGGVNPFFTFNPNQMMHFDIYGNFGPDTVSYGTNGESVAAFTYDVYVNGALVPTLNNAPFRNNLAQVTEFGFFGNTAASVQTAYIDNILVSDTLPVPEPGSFVLVSMAFISAICLRRRSK